MKEPWCFTSVRSSSKQVFKKQLIYTYFPSFEVIEIKFKYSLASFQSIIECYINKFIFALLSDHVSI